MEISKLIYQGELRTKAIHLKSGKEIITDAPTDNYGKGEAFSPTDLMSTSLAACMITIMGIEAEKFKFKLGEVEAVISKVMGVNPRRVIKIGIELTFKDASYTDEQKEQLKTAALNCPVAKSLHPEINQEISFMFK